MDYLQFYNEKTRRWQLRQFREYMKEKEISTEDEVQLAFSIVRFMLSKNKLSTYDKTFIIDLGFYLEQDHESFTVSKLISDKELMKMTKEDLKDNWQRLVNVRGESPKRYHFNGSEEDYYRLKKKFNSLMSEYLQGSISDNLFDDYLTYGKHGHYSRTKIKYNLKEKKKKRRFVYDLGLLLTTQKIKKEYREIVGAIMETIDLNIKESSVLTYIKEH